MNRKTKFQCVIALAALVSIGGCGGGGGGGGGNLFPIATAPAEPPAEPLVTQSPYDAFIAYLKGIVQTAVDTAEPVDVTAFDPAPVSDVLEPVATQ